MYKKLILCDFAYPAIEFSVVNHPIVVGVVVVVIRSVHYYYNSSLKFH